MREKGNRQKVVILWDHEFLSYGMVVTIILVPYCVEIAFLAFLFAPIPAWPVPGYEAESMPIILDDKPHTTQPRPDLSLLALA